MQEYPEHQKAPLSGLSAAREYIGLLADPIGRMRDLYQRHGSIVGLGPVVFGEPTKLHVMAIGPEWNRQIFSDPATFRPTGLLLRGPKKSAQRRIRHGLTRMTGSEHRQQRQLVAPPFSRAAVQGYHAIMVDVVQESLKALRPNETQDVYEAMRKLTLRIASSILFSHDPAEAVPIGRRLEDWMMQSFAPAVWGLPLNIPGTAYNGMLRNAAQIEEMILAMIAKRRRESGHSDVLSLLMEARDGEGRAMTDAELVGQIAILFVASFETTTSALTWTLFLLAQHPAVAHELMDELDSVLGGNPPTGEQMPQLPFLQCIIKESMRILPPVPYTVRVSECQVWVGPFYLLHGARVILSHYLTHHLPELYPEPERFRPERWREINPNQYEYLPFSAGPRMCIGAMFAMQVVKISVAMIMQRFRFTVVPGTRIDRVIRITMNPRHGLPMMVAPNDRKFSTSEVHGQIREMVTLP